MDFLSLFIHLDQHLHTLIQNYGNWTYAILFLIIFCETGLIVTPFLPGDSLLFVLGAFTATGHLDPVWLVGLLFAAAVLGDSVNYQVGRHLGEKAYKINSRFIKQTYLQQTQLFYEKYGNFTIVVARFVPIIRTFAPFVAGVGKMTYRRFMFYNVFGGFVWVGGLILVGHFFGNLPWVKQNLSLVVIGIVIVSTLPAVFHFIKVRRVGVRMSA